METGHAKKGKRRSAPRLRIPAGSVRPATLLPAIGIALSHPGTDREGRAGNFDKIPKNPIKFDKFLKRISPVGDCNKTGYYINLSVEHSYLAAKKVFRLSRAFARICDELRASPRISTQPPAGRPGVGGREGSVATAPAAAVNHSMIGMASPLGTDSTPPDKGGVKEPNRRERYRKMDDAMRRPGGRNSSTEVHDSPQSLSRKLRSKTGPGPGVGGGKNATP